MKSLTSQLSLILYAYDIVHYNDVSMTDGLLLSYRRWDGEYEELLGVVGKIGMTNP